MAWVPSRVLLDREGVPFTIRTLTAEDAADLLDFRTREIDTSPYLVLEEAEVLADDLDGQQRWLTQRLDSLAEVAIGAFRGEDEEAILVGNLSFHVIDRARLRHRGELGLSVEESERGRGIGSALIETLIAWARLHSFLELVALGVFHTNTRAMDLYRSLGFVEEGRRRDFFRLRPGEYADDVTMSLRVKPRGWSPPSS